MLAVIIHLTGCASERFWPLSHIPHRALGGDGCVAEKCLMLISFLLTLHNKELLLSKKLRNIVIHSTFFIERKRMHARLYLPGLTDGEQANEIIDPPIQSKPALYLQKTEFFEKCIL